MTSLRRQFTLRMSESIDQKIENLARDIGVSKNAFILMVLNKELKNVV